MVRALLLASSCLLLLVSCVAAGGWRRELATRSWDAVGFHENLVHSPMEDQIIIAVMDSGIWPESRSFSDEGLGPPPAKWKGICESGNSSIPFKCNNKIIGARIYSPPPYKLREGEEISPRDMTGHGTHVAATIAGVLVRNVSIHGGIGLGTARGAVPRARIAVYKVCWMRSCVGNEAAIRDAIQDGVDMISISNGLNGALTYESNVLSVRTFQAMVAGLFVSAAAGNNKTFDPYTVSNADPWIITVGNSAGSGTDYATYVTSGDGKRLEGAALNTNDSGKTMYPLVPIEEVTRATDPQQVGMCTPEYIKPESVKGKILLCHRMPYGALTNWYFDYLGCAGLLLDGTPDESFYASFRDNLHLSPITKTPFAILRGNDFKYLIEYYKNSKSTGQPATASIERTVSAPDTSPRIARQSGRGPNLSDINILKPDITAPGANQIDAVPGDNPAYKVKSGTSMSTPYVTGVAAYIKTLHPTWSAAAIKSALMTTATPVIDPYANQGPMAFGAGQISPVHAADPGLVYDIGELDYVKYLCQLGNSSNEYMHKITRNTSYDCAKLPTEKGWTLNYPSFAVPTFPNQPFVSVFQRTLTNVANTSVSNYKVIVSAPKELTVKVEPSVLAFTQVGQALSYTLTISGQLVKTTSTPVLSASIVWTDGSHQIRSPIAVFERPADFEAQFVKTHGYGSKLEFKS